MKRTLALLAAMTLCLPALAAKKPPAPAFEYYTIGTSSNAPVTTAAGTVLMGGGTDVDEAFQWMCKKANGGDFLVIRATGTDAYNPYISDLCAAAGYPANSVATLIIPSKAAANHEPVVARIREAEAVWISGGDQSNYVNYWKGTPLSAALQARIDAGMPIGGTSAGMAVLTQFIYSALGAKGVTSSQALADPYNRYITLDRDFVSIDGLEGIISDTHFVTRDRLGRDLAFFCRIYLNGWVSSLPLRGIAADEATALLIEPNLSARVVGTGDVYFERAPGTAEVCQSGVPLTYLNIAIKRVSSGGSFNLSRWTGDSVDYSVSANAGVLSSDSGSIY
ncbi:MAG: cyanophycinase [Steroidobacteraceae bacterium]|nr:cyanophycinase [Steroidobacteraceae bacterium]MCC7199761.1 cyanophycinase [Gammaproteobacteria bacterium]